LNWTQLRTLLHLLAHIRPEVGRITDKSDAAHEYGHEKQAAPYFHNKNGKVNTRPIQRHFTGLWQHTPIG
jgi:hypothetical protein